MHMNQTFNRLKKAIYTILFSLVITGVMRAGNNSPAADGQKMEPFLDSLIARMTLNEKLGQLAQFRWQWAADAGEVRSRYEQFIRDGRVGSFLGIAGVEHLARLQRMAVEESRLGIPLLFAEDVIHGYRTTFPVPLAEVSSWDTAAVRETARIAALEAAAAGLHWTYAPMVDIARDPRWGRIVEGAGEDPFLGSAMAAARVRGFQGSDLSRPNTLLACAKHFAAYGAAEGGRDYNVADISRRTLREVYLPPFHAAVRAGVGSVMAAFNEIGGVPMHASRYLLTDVLRGEWGFRGVVISDYTGVMELILHGVAADSGEAGALALKAGVDIDMVSGIYQRKVAERVRSGNVPEALVDEAVRRVLRTKYLLGLFDDPYRYLDADRETAAILAPAHLKAAREMARKSLVLLKNENNLLPLSRNIEKLAVIGGLADSPLDQLGPWKLAGRTEDAVTLLRGIREALTSGGGVNYSPGYLAEDFGDSSRIAEAVRLAEQSEAVVLVLGERADMSGEAASRASLDLPGVQNRLARRILAVNKNVAVVLMNGRPLSIGWLAENAPAILESWFGGLQAGPAVADVLFGNFNPGGKLPVTFPRSVGQVPLYYNHKNTGRPPSEEKYTSKYLQLPSEPLFPFGYGLSYTRFSYHNLQLSDSLMGPGDTLSIRVEVSNSGERSGTEVVQLYIRDVVAEVTRPVKELRGFRRISLQPGESETITFRLQKDDLAYYNLEMNKVTESGQFEVFAGGNSRDLLKKSFRYAGKEISGKK